MIGSVLFAAARRVADERLAGEGKGRTRRFRTEPTPAADGLASEATRRSLDEVMEVSAVDPQRDEELFERGLRRLIASFAASRT